MNLSKLIRDYNLNMDTNQGIEDFAVVLLQLTIDKVESLKQECLAKVEPNLDIKLDTYNRVMSELTEHLPDVSIN